MPQSRILKDKLYRNNAAANELLRLSLRYITHNQSLPPRIRYSAQLSLNKFPISTRHTAVKNRCIETGRARWVLRDFGLTRHVFREKAKNGELPGVMKASW
ncbi:hypothetical protein BKA69DRAFT_1043264 [Paraphysoderma sedebokerense]|nr:hypothetical protein BKA69DRAFT_1096772 [Paraphysoderma sedebokerense]KAI9146158.1 hypothetical protein BKA69DRAFT_1043264 [Paraphysoderma sedebokerense]